MTLPRSYCQDKSVNLPMVSFDFDCVKVKKDMGLSIEYGYTCNFFLKNNRYIKHEKSHYLLAVVYNSVIKFGFDQQG